MVMWKQLNLFTKPCKSEDFISIHVLPFPDLQRIHCYTVMWEWDAILVQWISQSFLNERTWSQTNTNNIYRPFGCRQFHHLNPTEGVHWEVEPVYRAIQSEFAALTNHILTVWAHILWDTIRTHISTHTQYLLRQAICRGVLPSSSAILQSVFWDTELFSHKAS